MAYKVISFLDEKGKVILKNNIKSLPLKEEIIIQKSIEMFGDPEPCILHKTCAMKKLFIEIDDFFEEKINNDIREIKWKEIDVSIKEKLDVYGELSKVIF